MELLTGEQERKPVRDTWPGHGWCWAAGGGVVQVSYLFL